MAHLTRRRALAVGLATATGLAGCQIGDMSGTEAEEDDGSRSGDGGSEANGSTPGDGLETLQLEIEELTSGLASPIGIATPTEESLYVVDQAGQIRLFEDENLVDRPILDVADRMIDVSGVSEMGLLGIALHPQFTENGRLFLRYSAPPREGTPDEYSHTFVLSEFHTGEDETSIDPDSERVLLTIPEPQSNHNAGTVTFGPDGYLYVGVGDGGAGNDQGTGHVEDWYDDVEGGNGQDVTENLLGSVLRIDVDGEGSETSGTEGGDTADQDGDTYGIPSDNPLVDSEGLDEHYAWGFRNPWRLSFGPDGRLFVADVGQSSYEEINVVERGGNYGWNVYEGRECFQTDQCPDETDDGEPFREPIVAYPRSDAEVSGISVIGGYVYDGSEIPALQGRYVFGDWRANGEVFVATENDRGDWSVTAVPVDGLGSMIHSFGRDANGELLICTTQSGSVSEQDGTVYRLRPP